jgi:WD40 repeat protein
VDYADDSGGGVIRLYDSTTGEQSTEFELPGNRAWNLQFSPDGKQLAAAMADGSIAIWNLP